MSDVLKRKYGDRVSIRYVDVVDDNMEEYPEIEKYLRQAGTRVLPLLVVNGQITRSGFTVSYLEFVEEIESLGLMEE